MLTFSTLVCCIILYHTDNVCTCIQRLDDMMSQETGYSIYWNQSIFNIVYVTVFIFMYGYTNLWSHCNQEARTLFIGRERNANLNWPLEINIFVQVWNEELSVCCFYLWGWIFLNTWYQYIYLALNISISLGCRFAHDLHVYIYVVVQLSLNNMHQGGIKQYQDHHVRTVLVYCGSVTGWQIYTTTSAGRATFKCCLPWSIFTCPGDVFSVISYPVWGCFISRCHICNRQWEIPRK